MKLHRELEFQEFFLGYFQNCEELTDWANGLEWEQLDNKMNEQIKQNKKTNLCESLEETKLTPQQ